MKRLKCLDVIVAVLVSAGTAVTAASLAQAAAPAGANHEVWAALEAAVAGCEVSDRYGTLDKCKADEKKALEDAVKKATPLGALDTLSLALLSDDPKVAGVTANLMYSKVKDNFSDAGKNPALLAPATVDRLFAGLTKLDGMKAMYATRTLVHAAMISGQDERLYQALDAHPEKQVRTEGYGWVMQFGRMKAFPKIQQLATGAEKQLGLTALAAPRNMFKWTAEESAVICPWGKGFLSSEDLKVADAAGWLMVRCKGEYIDALLEDGEKRLAAGGFKQPYSQIFREPCFSFIPGTATAADVAQCDRVYAFLEKVANTETVESSVRGLSLWNIYYQRRDQQSLDLMRKYEAHADPEIVKRAQDAIKSLTTTYKLK